MQKHPDLPQAFAQLGVETSLLKALRKMGFVEPTDIQRRLIPHALEGRDILGQARTGTGKTAAFGLPILQRLDRTADLQALCLCPTRELAVQVTGEMKRLAEFVNLHIVAVYGGQRIATQLHQLGRKPHFVVGTPGRVLDMMHRGVLRTGGIRFAVLDEVDRMLDIGFREDIQTILRRVTGPHQTIFVSATVDEAIRQLAMRFLHDHVDVDVSADKLTVDEVDQSYVTVGGPEKFAALRRILAHEDPPITIVFCNTKAAARKLTRKLHDAGFNAKEIHGDLVQAKRERVMERFRRHQIRVLVATDLAARGIDVSAISHIINYDIPLDPEVYVHRIGRTARMGARGVAITLVGRDQGKELTNIEKLINREIPQRTVPGFTPSERTAPREPEQPERLSRLRAPVYAETEAGASSPPPKTLGSRFRPARGRRKR